MVKSFNVIESNLAWNVVNGRLFRIGVDPWVGCTQQHILLAQTVEALRERDIIFLYQLANPVQGNIWFQSWRLASTLGLNALD